jgi:predicted  nucleic acid-binding Zn-ribbon protein
VKADPFDQLKLLDLQALDAALSRLAARRRAVPALSAIVEAEQQLTVLRDTLVGYETEAADQARAAAKLETEIEQVRNRSDRDRTRLDTGSVPANQLESLQSEIASLARRQASLEDDELEILELREQADHGAEKTRTSIASVEDTLAAATTERDEAFAGLDAEAAAATRQREELAPQLPEDLRALYERLRIDRNGVGAAALVRRRCEGCHLELAGNELAAVRAATPQEVLRHDDCGRILVRTAESGL